MIEIKPIGQIEARVTMPGSKSYTQRAMIMAALAEGDSRLQGPLISEDTGYLAEALRLLGANLESKTGTCWSRAQRDGSEIRGEPIYLGYNGTAMRLLTTVVCLGKGEFLLTGAPRLLERPIQPLLEALKTLGVKAVSKDKPGFPPVLIEANGLQGGKVIFKNIESSQYISSLLISAPLARDDFTLELEGAIPSLPYVEMTAALMKQFGVKVTRENPTRFFIKSRQKYQGIDLPDRRRCLQCLLFFLSRRLVPGDGKGSAHTFRNSSGRHPLSQDPGSARMYGYPRRSLGGGYRGKTDFRRIHL